jgi:signal transduction histidine kinase
MPIHLPQLLVSLFIYGLGFFAFSKNTRSNIHFAFFFLALTSATWLLLYYFAYQLPYDRAQYLFRAGFSSAIFIGAAAYHFVSAHVRSGTENKFIFIAYALSFVFAALLWGSDLLLQRELQLFAWGYYPRADVLHPLFLAFLTAMVIRSNVLLYRYYVEQRRDKNKLEELKTRYVFFAICMYEIGPIDFFVNYGIPIRPIGFIFAAVYSTSMAYAIMRHQLMDIEVVIRRTAVFAGLFAFVYTAFSAVMIIGQTFFSDTLGWNAWAALIPTVFIVTLALRPLENFLTNATEKFLFQKKYDYRELLKTFTNEILTVLDLEKLTEQTVAGLMRIIKLESACVLMLDREARQYRLVASSGLRDKDAVFKENDTIVEYLKVTHHPILKDEEADRVQGDGRLKEDFKKLNAQLCLPISLHDDLIGILALGRKKSGEDYTQEDIDILSALARTEAIAISNARLFDELSKTQAEAAQREKMAVIGTLAAGINHEICNPLGIVRGHCELFLLNSKDGLYSNKSSEEILKTASEIMTKVIRETDRATGITKKLSSFAKPSKRTEMEEVRVEKEVDEVVGLVGHDLRLNNIDIRKDFPGNFPVILADRKQIQEVLFNIIRNAAQAIENKQGQILVSGFTDNGSAVVRISDNGTGIPQDKLNHIFSPFYTTKGPEKGTGLGLFIVKQVVERNKGAISVESEPGIGTTFTLRFPTAMAALKAGN